MAPAKQDSEQLQELLEKKNAQKRRMKVSGKRIFQLKQTIARRGSAGKKQD